MHAAGLDGEGLVSPRGLDSGLDEVPGTLKMGTLKMGTLKMGTLKMPRVPRSADSALPRLTVQSLRSETVAGGKALASPKDRSDGWIFARTRARRARTTWTKRVAAQTCERVKDPLLPPPRFGILQRM